jgi:transcriptional regulator with PAS, ATPase and Fis domain
MPKLVVLEGANRGAVLRVLPDRNRLGRDPEAELSLPDDGVSRLHAAVVLQGTGYALEDAGSKNGTYLNGIRVASPAVLSHGDELRLGTTVLVFLDDDQDPPSVRGGETRVVVEESGAARTSVPARSRLRYLVGESPALERVSRMVERCAPLDSTVLVTGESGTGKELVAEGLHRLSPRRRGPFIALNGATLEPRLLESELFGHERGAFTGAVARKLGKLELARSGTFFLDEVGELPLETQAKLLRAIEKREFQRVGGHELLRTDARIVAATNRDLASLVKEGRFRDDLRFRLQVVEIAIPPLRERREDVKPLVEHFVSELRERIPSRARRFSSGAIAHLERHPFPGNVRELRNIVERCLIFAESEEVKESELPLAAPAAPPAEEILSLEAVEKRHIERALAALEGNKTRAAERLGIDRATLYAKIKKYGL